MCNTNEKCSRLYNQHSRRRYPFWKFAWTRSRHLYSGGQDLPLWVWVIHSMIWVEWTEQTHWIGCTVPDEPGTGCPVDARLIEMSSAFEIPSDGETHGGDSGLRHFGRTRHPQYCYPGLISRRSGTFLQGGGFGGEVICRRWPDRLNRPRPLHPPFLSSYVHAPPASSPSAMGSEWRCSPKRQE